MTLTCRTSESIFACGVSTATPLFRATRRTATSHMRRSRASLGPSLATGCPRAPAITSCAGFDDSAPRKWAGNSAPREASTLFAGD
ncbi:MAG: hypothetical protein CL967_05490 [Euryarchaeota archaeon]|nr:hypothetical protein [Euryarchaeota archaeon]